MWVGLIQEAELEGWLWGRGRRVAPPLCNGFQAWGGGKGGGGVYPEGRGLSGCARVGVGPTLSSALLPIYRGAAPEEEAGEKPGCGYEFPAGSRQGGDVGPQGLLGDFFGGGGVSESPKIEGFHPTNVGQEEENRLREELRQEWEAKQEKIKSEPMGGAVGRGAVGIYGDLWGWDL